MHDDQHGIISSAALLNALELADKRQKIKLVVSGAGSAALACADLYVLLGVKLKIFSCSIARLLTKDNPKLSNYN
jgi:malate dehydrogenase (oxaloacetate-decarboxylating)(NADP+)